MLEPSGDVDLPKKSLRTKGSGELMAQQLDRDEPAVLEVMGQVNGCHSPATELVLDAIAISQGSCQRGYGVGQVTLCEVCLKMRSHGVTG